MSIQSVPRCPNHGEPLELSREQRNEASGKAPCPVSGILFDFEQDVEQSQKIKDKFGNLVEIKSFKVTGEE